MEGADVQAETIALMEQIRVIDEEISLLVQPLSLQPPDEPAITGNLTGSTGFPRADTKTSVVKAARKSIAELRNMRKAITEKIDQNIQVLRSAKSTAPTASSSVKDACESSTMDTDVGTSSRPFAKVDEITEDSPVAEDGLQLGDLVLKFGDVEYGQDDLFQRVTAEAQKNQGHVVPMDVLRDGVLVNLEVTPREWEGHGLLGCNFRIL